MELGMNIEDEEFESAVKTVLGDENYDEIIDNVFSGEWLLNEEGNKILSIISDWYGERYNKFKKLFLSDFSEWIADKHSGIGNRALDEHVIHSINCRCRDCFKARMERENDD